MNNNDAHHVCCVWHLKTVMYVLSVATLALGLRPRQKGCKVVGQERVPGEKSHLDVGSVASHKVYYKGEGGGFPQVWAVVNLVRSCCSWLVLAPKVFQLCTNPFVWVVCRPVWMSEACQLFLVPSRSSNTPFYPSKCCELGSVPRLLLLPLSFTWTQGVGSASHGIRALGGLDPLIGEFWWHQRRPAR